MNKVKLELHVSVIVIVPFLIVALVLGGTYLGYSKGKVVGYINAIYYVGMVRDLSCNNAEAIEKAITKHKEITQ